MQDHLKERLTGAAILVAVVVLLVPEMFRGRPAAGTERGASGSEGAPVRTYNIDLRDSPAAQPPAVTDQPLAMPPAAAAVQPAVTVPATAGQQAGATSAAPAFGQSTAASATATVTRPTAPAAAARRAEGAASGWTVQVGSFTRRDFAERLVRQVRSRGFTVEAVGPDDRGLYRVRSAPLAERAAALALKEKMQARGLKPIVNGAP